MDRLQQVLGEFQEDVERIEHLLELVKDFREFGGSTIPVEVAKGEVTWQEANSLWKASKLRRTDLPWLSGSLLLYLAGRFEYFARQIVQTVAEDMADGVEKYVCLPETLRKQLSKRTLEVAQNPRRYGYDERQAEAFLLNLAENLNGGSCPPSISATVLCITDANLKDRILAGLMQRVGIEGFWKDVGKQTRLKLILEKTTDGEATAEAQNRLNRLMDERNQIAHPTSATSFPDPDQVLRTSVFLKSFGEVTTEIVRVYLAGFLAKHKAS